MPNFARIDKNTDIVVNLEIIDDIENFQINGFYFIEVPTKTGYSAEIGLKYNKYEDFFYNPKDTQARPWDIFNPNKPKADEKLKNHRLDICHQCDKLHFGVCSECGCVMALKTTLLESFCPIGKW